MHMFIVKQILLFAHIRMCHQL